MIRFVLVLLLAILSVPAVSAQEASPTPEPFPRVRDAARRTDANRINDLLGSINERHQRASRRILDNAQRILDRIAQSADRRALNGYDVSAVREAIAVARQALDEARMAVRDQSSRSYELADATDRTLGDRMRAVRDEMKHDLDAVRAKVRVAVSAVHDASTALRSSRPASPTPMP